MAHGDYQRLQMEYRGYVVHFAENQEVWRCQALDVEGEKIGTVKAKIDKIIAQSRKLANPVPMIYLDYHEQAASVQVVALAQPKRDRSGEEKEPDQAWCMRDGTERYYSPATGKHEHRETRERKKLPLSMLYLDTPETRVAIAAIAEMKAQQRQLDQNIKDVRAGMASALGHFHVEIEESE